VTLSFHGGADLDILEAARFYRQQVGPKLAARFLDEIDRVIDMLVAFPGLGTPADEARRIHMPQGFPCSAIYPDEGHRIRVLVVRSQYRDPQHGASRI
jgi:plasmid stabilization system protein ParE